MPPSGFTTSMADGAASSVCLSWTASVRPNSRVVISAEASEKNINLAYFIDDSIYNREGDAFWVKGESTADLLLRAPIVAAIDAHMKDAPARRAVAAQIALLEGIGVDLAPPEPGGLRLLPRPVGGDVGQRMTGPHPGVGDLQSRIGCPTRRQSAESEQCRCGNNGIAQFMG